MRSIQWARLDVWGQVMGEPFRGDVEALYKHARQGVEDIATFTKSEETFYLVTTGRTVRCTVITMITPWGKYRYIPANATRLPKRRRRWAMRRRRTRVA